MKLSTLTSLLASSPAAVAFLPPKCPIATSTIPHKSKHHPPPLFLGSEPPPDEEDEEYNPDRLLRSDPTPYSDDSRTDAEGASLASEFFDMLRERNIEMTGDEIDHADLREGELEGAGGGRDPDAGSLDFEDEIALEEYRRYEIAREFMEVERQEFTDDGLEDYGMGLEYSDEGAGEGGGGMLAAAASGGAPFEEFGVYEPPGILMPDHNLPARDVVELVLQAMQTKNIDNPTQDYGIQVFLLYCSDSSSIKRFMAGGGEPRTPSDYRELLLSRPDTAFVLQHESIYFEREQVGADKAYFTVRLMEEDDPGSDYMICKFVMSLYWDMDESVWMIDSMNVRPKDMRRMYRRRD